MKKGTLYVSDLDGTLLNKDTEISDYTAHVLNKLIQHDNLLFTAATARTPATAVPKLNKISIKLPLIVMTGAAMWNIHDKAYSNTTALNRKNVDSIVQICNLHNINPFVYTIEGEKLKVQHSEILNNQEDTFIAERINSPFKHFYLEDKIQPTESVLIFATDKYPLIEKVYHQIISTVECEATCYHDIYSPEYGFLEVFAKGTTKADAIKNLARQINADKIVVFGDNLNDISMLKAADIAIAVGNAYPEVKAIATEVIGLNSDDSVAKWLEANHDTI